MIDVKWPAIVKYAGDSELLYLASEQVWCEDYDLHALGFQDNDCLVDSAGHVFALVAPSVGLAAGVTCLEPTQTQASLAEVEGWLLAHEAQLGSCCVAKFKCQSIAEAFAAVALSQDA